MRIAIAPVTPEGGRAVAGFADRATWLRRAHGFAGTTRANPRGARVREDTVLGSSSADGGSTGEEFQAAACYH